MSNNGHSNGSSVLSREAFFTACKERNLVKKEIKDWGNVNIRKMTLGQIRMFDEAKDNYERAKMLILHSIADGKGDPIFQNIAEVDTLEMPLFKALSDAVSEVNGLRDGDAEGKAKNSETATSSVLN